MKRYLKGLERGFMKTGTNYKTHFKRLMNTSINKPIEVIKHIAKYNYDNELSSANHISNFKKLKPDTRETQTIDAKLIIKILDYLESLELTNIVVLRNALSIFLMKDTGARLNEILHIECNHLDFENNSIHLTFTKTGKSRKVYFSDRTKKHLQDYLTRPELANSKYLFINFQTKEIVFKSFLYYFIEDIKKALGINCSISPHKWRHTLATTLFDQNVNATIVQKVLGHCSLEITQRYIHTSDKLIKDNVLNVIN